MHHNLGIAFNQDIQFGILRGTGFFACRVETSFGGDAGTGAFEDLGHVGAVGDGPSSFFCTREKEISNFVRMERSGRVGI